jgi:hypothetical protein
VTLLEGKRMLVWLRATPTRSYARFPAKPDRLDTATRIAMDADFSDRGGPTTHLREPHWKLDLIVELERILKVAGPRGLLAER